MFLADLHIHSNFSDGLHSIPELVDVYAKRGFGAIAITDHICEQQTVIGSLPHIFKRTLTPAIYPLYLEILKSEADRGWHQYGMVLIPRFELSQNSLSNSRSAHILGLGVQQFMAVTGEIEQMARGIRALGGLTSAVIFIH